MRPVLVEDETEADHLEGEETRSEPPSDWSERTYLLLVSRGPNRFRKAVDWFYGRSAILRAPKPWLRLPSKNGPINLEPLLIHWTRPFTSPILLAILIAAYIVSLSFFARAQWYQTPADEWADCTSAFWAANDRCGLNGQLCMPFYSSIPVQFRCPGMCPSVILANQRAVGNLEVIYQPLVVGGGDHDFTYRGDSWICSAAVHAGLIAGRRGGCGSLQLIGTSTNYVGANRNGIHSVPFPSTFPLSYRFLSDSGRDHCEDLRDEALAFNILVTLILSLILRPKPLVLFWCLVCIGFWHITFFSDPRASPPPVSQAFGAFLPTLFACYAFWRCAVRFVLPAFSHLPIERTFWYIGGFWLGVLFNLTIDKIPVDRLLVSDVKARPGGIVAVIVLAILVLLLAANQIRIIRKAQRLPAYLGYYVLGGLVIMVLALLPGLTFRLHHYIFAMLLIPGTAFPTRISALLQALLLGMFLNGVSRWDFASILQTTAELRRDGALGSSLPPFSNMTYGDLNATSNSSIFGTFFSFVSDNNSSPIISWPDIPAALATSEGWNAFSLLVDDVERYSGTALNYSIGALDWSTRHFFRLAYQKSGVSGDYTRAATIFPNGTYIPPPSGPS